MTGKEGDDNEISADIFMPLCRIHLKIFETFSANQ